MKESPARGPSCEVEHRYGPRVHVLDNLYVRSAMARLCSPVPRISEVLELVRAVYESLFAAAARELPSVQAEVPTRMSAQHPRAAVLRGPVLDSGARYVVCEVLRAGLVPAQVVFERLLSVLPDECARLDHLCVSRLCDAAGRVSGAEIGASKIGGAVEGATLLLPDPMGATGLTTVRVVEHYLERYGRPARIVALPMIATPEYLRRVLERFDQLVVYTARIDRGLSPPDVLASLPGTHWERERGLDERSYVVPGAGGVGEILNNSNC